MDRLMFANSNGEIMTLTQREMAALLSRITDELTGDAQPKGLISSSTFWVDGRWWTQEVVAEDEQDSTKIKIARSRAPYSSTEIGKRANPIFWVLLSKKSQSILELLSSRELLAQDYRRYWESLTRVQDFKPTPLVNVSMDGR